MEKRRQKPSEAKRKRKSILRENNQQQKNSVNTNGKEEISMWKRKSRYEILMLSRLIGTWVYLRHDSYLFQNSISELIFMEHI